MARGRGGGKTPENLVRLLSNAVANSNKAAVARDLGIGVAAVHRYLKGIGEPSDDTLQKLAVYFGVSVPWLRGYDETESRGPTAQELWVIAEIREALGVRVKPMLAELPGIVRAMREELEWLKARLEDDLK